MISYNTSYSTTVQCHMMTHMVVYNNVPYCIVYCARVMYKTLQDVLYCAVRRVVRYCTMMCRKVVYGDLYGTVRRPVRYRTMVRRIYVIRYHTYGTVCRPAVLATAQNCSSRRTEPYVTPLHCTVREHPCGTVQRLVRHCTVRVLYNALYGTL